MLEFVLEIDRIVPSKLANAFVEVANEAGVSTRDLAMYGERVRENQLDTLLSGRSSFHIEGGGLKTHLTSVASCRVGLLRFWNVPAPLHERLTCNMISLGAVISLRHADDEYDYWQNVEDPVVYEAAGRSVTGLPMINNGLPAPLSRRMVDVRTNPGRAILRVGYNEAIAARMLLGPSFFRRVPRADRDEIISTTWLSVFGHENGFVEVVAQSTPFVDVSTADLQSQLRGLLFPTYVKNSALQ